MIKHKLLPVLLLLCAVACNGTLEVGIERTPTPDHAVAATLTALMAENSLLATRVATMATPAPPVLPDVGRVAYVQGGDIWIKVLPEGKPQRLTTDGRNREPRWSPSGEWLAFRKDKQVTVEQDVPCDIPKPRAVCTDRVAVMQKQVWLIEANGSGAHPLNQGASVDAFAWSPAGDRVAYSVAAQGLSTINADGTDSITLVSPAPPDRGDLERLGRFAWSPDGAWVAYEWWRQVSDQPSAYQGLWKVSGDGKERLELYNSGLPKKGEVVLAGWSPLGKTVLFWQSEVPLASLADGMAFYAVPAEKPSPKASAPVRLDTEAVLTYADFIAPAPSGTIWGGRDAIALIEGGGRSAWKNKRIQVGGQTITPKNLAAVSPDWSPKGTHVAFSAMPDWTGPGTAEPVQSESMQRRIWVTNVVGEPQSRRLTDSAGYRDERPLWSADGNHILFVRMDTKGRVSLWIASLDQGALRQVVDELTPAPDPLGFYGHVDWDALFDWWRGATA
jgi:Tol biopolymer transport system component